MSMNKMIRQLNLYLYLTDQEIEIREPKSVMKKFDISRRMLQRDLKDLRECGVINVVFNKKENSYFESEEPAIFIEDTPARRRQHLVRLNRLCTLIDKLPYTDLEEYERYEEKLSDYIYYRDELSVENPKEYPPEDIGEPPVKPSLPDLKSSYYELFPDVNDRTRQRDFNILNEAGLTIIYSRRYHGFFCLYADQYFGTCLEEALKKAGDLPAE